MLATTRGALLRGSTTDDLGDEVDTNGAPLVQYTEWAEQRRNLVPNPRAAADGTAFGPDHMGVSSFVTDFPGDVETAVRWTRTGAGAARARPIVLGTQMPGNRKPIGFRLLIRSSDECTLQPTARPNVNSTTGQSSLSSTIPVPAGVSLYSASGLSFDGNPGNNSGIVLVAGAGSVPVGGWLDVTAIDLELGGVPVDYLDGWGDTDDTTRRRWATAPNNSQSVLETRELVGDWSDFPLSLIEKTTREQDPATNLWRTVRYFAARVPSNLPVDDGDRIRDNRDGAVYAIDSFRREPRSLAGRASTTLKLRRTSP